MENDARRRFEALERRVHQLEEKQAAHHTVLRSLIKVVDKHIKILKKVFGDTK